MLTIDAPRDINPNLGVVDGAESVRQRVAQRVRMFLGEWFLNTAAGVPYYREILTRPTSVGAAVSAITSAIRSVEGVADVLNAEGEIEGSTRLFLYRADVTTSTGETFPVEAGEQ